MGGHAHRQVQSILGYSLKKKPWSHSQIDGVWIIGNEKKSEGMGALRCYHPTVCASQEMWVGRWENMHIVQCKHFRLIFEEKAMVSFKD